LCKSFFFISSTSTVNLKEISKVILTSFAGGEKIKDIHYTNFVRNFHNDIVDVLTEIFPEIVAPEDPTRGEWKLGINAINVQESKYSFKLLFYLESLVSRGIILQEDDDEDEENSFQENIVGDSPIINDIPHIPKSVPKQESSKISKSHLLWEGCNQKNLKTAISCYNLICPPKSKGRNSSPPGAQSHSQSALKSILKVKNFFKNLFGGSTDRGIELLSFDKEFENSVNKKSGALILELQNELSKREKKIIGDK